MNFFLFLESVTRDMISFDRRRIFSFDNLVIKSYPLFYGEISTYLSSHVTYVIGGNIGAVKDGKQTRFWKKSSALPV